MINLKSKKGFTLIELIIVIAIIAILTAIAVPKVIDYIEDSRIAADQGTVKNLNTMTTAFRMFTSSSDPFEDEDNTDEELLETLVEGGYLTSVVEPQTDDATFEWSFDDEKWYLTFEDSNQEIDLDRDNLTLNSSGRLSGSYNIDSSKDIVIPASLDGTTIKEIYQDVFNNKDLVAVSFGEDSQINHIHARAFLNNNLADIDFPDTLTRIDYGAFKDNNLTEINLSSNMATIEGSAFDGNDLSKITMGSSSTTIAAKAFGSNTDQFKEAYTSGGIGTYSLVNGIWTKQG
jgi:prepilin-type N-terminal cleavage/methylation domain-containing protein